MKVFVSVGTQKFPFDRLLRLADETAGNRPDIQFFEQTGQSGYHPEHCESKDFLNADEFGEQIQSCDLLIVHSGVGTIIKGLNLHKRIVVVPRLAQYAEHVDDHQLQIAESFADKNLVLCYQEGDNLSDLIDRAMAHSFAPYISHRKEMVTTIEEYLETLR